MKQKNIIPEISVFFILFSNGDTHYFTVKKEKEIFKIYWNDFIEAYEYEEGSIVPVAHSIEITKNSFELKSTGGETVCNLETYNKKVNEDNRRSGIICPPEIEKVYIDPELRTELLARGQLNYDEDARRIPGILYEAIKEELEINTDEFFTEEVIEEPSEEETEQKPFTRGRRLLNRQRTH